MNSINKQNNEINRPAYLGKNNNISNSNEYGGEKYLFQDRINYENGLFQKLCSKITLVSNLFDKYRYRADTNILEYKQNLFKERFDLEDERVRVYDSFLSGFSKYLNFVKSKLESVSAIKNIKFKRNIFTGRAYIDFAKVHALTSLFKKNPIANNLNNLTVKNQRKTESIQKDNFKRNSPLYWGVSSVAVITIISLIYLITNRNYTKNEVINSDVELTGVVDNSKDMFAEDVDLSKRTNLASIDQNQSNIDVGSYKIIENKTNEKNIQKEFLVVDEIINENSDATENQSEIADLSEIEKLLKLAVQQFDAEKLTTPAGDNAHETYQYILLKNPEHVDAMRGLKKIHAKYMQWANQKTKHNEYVRAEKYLANALMIEPNNKQTIKALNELTKLKSEIISKSKLLSLTESAPIEIQPMLNKAYKRLIEAEKNIVSRERDYKVFLDTQLSYQRILKLYPDSKAAIMGLLMLKKYYLDLAKIESQRQNKNISAFFNQQAKSVNVSETDL